MKGTDGLSANTGPLFFLVSSLAGAAIGCRVPRRVCHIRAIMWRGGAKLSALTLLGGAGAAAIATSDDPSSTFKICTIVPLRLIRDSITAATMAFDYQYSLWGLKEGSIEWLRAKHEVHNRCAYRLQELCFRNGGIYIKLGQHIGQLEYVVPQEYVQTMRASMLKRCPVSSYDQVRSVFVKELGKPPEKIFAEFDPVPLASASLAQVHAARTRDGEKVAVKVQHAHLRDTAIADIATVGLVVNFLHWFFPAFDYRWLVDEIQESAPKGNKTDIVICKYDDNFLVMATQIGCMGTILRARKDETVSVDPTFNVSVVFGKRDEPYLLACARQLIEHISSCGSPRPLVLSLGLKDHSPGTLKDVISAVIDNRLW